MKRLFALLTSCAMLLTGCGSAAKDSKESETTVTSSSEQAVVPAANVEQMNFTSLNDPNLLQYINDAVYSDLEQNYASDDYIIESVSSIYKSKEYLDNLAYNSKENIYFGFTLSELLQQFEGTKYVFTVNDAGETTVKEFEGYDDTFDKVIRNVAIGTGVILICVTVSVATGGTASVIMAASAKTATSFALSSGAISGISTALITGIQTHDMEATLKASALKASEGFMWGAITGAVVGGTAEGIKIAKSGKKASEAVAGGSSPEIGKAGEEYAQNFYKGDTQLSYMGGKEVPYGTNGATRPDIIVKKANGAVEAVEVKSYDLVNRYQALENELKRQVGQRVKDLPAGSTQRIALVTKGRGYSKQFVNEVVEKLQTALLDTYGSKIPIDVL